MTDYMLSADCALTTPIRIFPNWDKKTGKYRLSMRALQPKPEGYVERERAPRGERPRREGGDRR